MSTLPIIGVMKTKALQQLQNHNLLLLRKISICMVAPVARGRLTFAQRSENTQLSQLLRRQADETKTPI